MPRPQPAPATLVSGPYGLPVAVWFGLLAAAALAAYWPALAGSLLWDDAGHVTHPELQSWSGLWRIWFEVGATQQYYPILHSAFWLEHRLWGDAVIGYHVINVLQHATAAGLLGLVLRRLAVPGAWLAAWLFLLHPVCVESVAWISEQKNTLSLVLYLAAALAWLRFDQSRRPAGYALATGLFLLALLTKTVTASLPAALLVVAWWQRGKVDWRRDVAPLLPWFVLGTLGGLFTAHFERALIGAQGADFVLGVADRVVLAGRVFWFYLGKLAWPADLIFVYPRWHIDAAVWWQWLFPAAALALLAGLAGWSRRARGPLAVALLFGGSLFPVLGFVNVYPFVFSYVADHFQYLASLAVFAAAGTALSRLPKPASISITVLLLPLLGTLTCQQAGIYRNDTGLYETTLRRNPDAWLAHHNLATILVDTGRPDAALFHIERTLALRPDYPEALSKLGDCLTRLGRPAEAVPHLERAIQLQPKFAEAHNNLGVTFMSLGRAEEGRSQFENAVRLNPDYATAQRNLGVAFANAGRPSEALPHFERAAQLLPQDTEAGLQLGMTLLALSRPSEALPHFEAALAAGPDSAPVHYQMALTLRALGRNAEASAHYQEAIALDPRLTR